MELWQQILLTEESARIQARGVPHMRGDEPRPQRQKKPQTFIFERSNYSSPLSLIKILDIDGKSGVIEDVVIKAPSSDYTVDLMIDDHIVNFMHTWSELNELSQDVESVVAVARNGQYITGISNMYFTNRVTLNILATGITFKKIFAKVTYDG